MIITSIDFETANQSRVSMCAAAMAVFKDGVLMETPYWLVRPPKGYGWFHGDFSNIHHLTWFDVKNALGFERIAPDFLQRLACADIVTAHNAQFDIGVLQATLEHFGLACPAFDYVCTLKLARRVWPDLPDHRLSTLAAHIGHKFDHHHAQSDAEAAGRVLLGMVKQANVLTPLDLLSHIGMVPIKFTKFVQNSSNHRSQQPQTSL